MSAGSTLDFTDQDLLRRYREEPELLDELIRRYQDRVRRCARRMSVDRSQAEDLVQETFLRLLLALPRYRGQCAFGTWVYAIAHNTCVDAARRYLRQPKAADLDDLAARGCEPAGSDLVDEELEAQIRDCYVGRAIAALPISYQSVVQLRLGEGLSNQAAAHRLGTSIESVKAKLQRARKLLRRRLSESAECPLCQGLGTFRIVPRIREAPTTG